MRQAAKDLAAVMVAGVIVIGLIWSFLALAGRSAVIPDGNGNAAGSASHTALDA